MIFASNELRSLEDFAGLELGTVRSMARTRQLRSFELGGFGWYLKVQDLRGRSLPSRKLMSYFFRGSPVKREAKSIETLKELGVRTPRLVATGMRCKRGLPELAILLTRELEGYSNLVDYLAHCPSRELAADVIALAEALVESVHAKGYALLGAKYRNILVSAGETQQEPAYRHTRLALVDQPDLARSSSKRLFAKDWRHMRQDKERYGP